MKGNGKTNKITKEFLKRTTVEFDIGCIYNLSLPSLGIFDLGCIGDCNELVVLDLSNNNISCIRPLATLKHLQILNLERNRISDLSGVDEITSLYSLNLAGNFLNSVHALIPLQNLEKFESLYLSSSVKSLTNPVCQGNVNLREEILQLLPRLKLFEGEVLTGKGSEFAEFCCQLDTAFKERQAEISNRRIISLEKSSNDSISGCTTDFMKASDSLSLAEKRVQDLIDDCDSANNKAKSVVDKAKKSLSSS